MLQCARHNRTTFTSKASGRNQEKISAVADNPTVDRIVWLLPITTTGWLAICATALVLHHLEHSAAHPMASIGSLVFASAVCWKSGVLPLSPPCSRISRNNVAMFGHVMLHFGNVRKLPGGHKSLNGSIDRPFELLSHRLCGRQNMLSLEKIKHTKMRYRRTQHHLRARTLQLQRND